MNCVVQKEKVVPFHRWKGWGLIREKKGLRVGGRFFREVYEEGVAVFLVLQSIGVFELGDVVSGVRTAGMWWR